jgi:mono/diheme cytochrome c family protein
LAKCALLSCFFLLGIPALSADEPKTPPKAPSAAPSVTPPAAPPAPADGMKPADRVEATPKGRLKNPYSDDNAAIVEAGHKLYMGYGCNGCHGGNGGGGICPPLINDTWVYGGDDDTLFRLVTLGSDVLQSKGYTRIGMENVVAPMPPMGPIIATDDDLWRIVTFIRANFHGEPENKFGQPPETVPANP